MLDGPKTEDLAVATSREHTSVAVSVLVGTISAGWLVPMWASVVYVKKWCEQDLLPRCGTGIPLTSFPLLDPALWWFTLAVLWLGVVIAGWVTIVVRKRTGRPTTG